MCITNVQTVTWSLEPLKDSEGNGGIAQSIPLELIVLIKKERVCVCVSKGQKISLSTILYTYTFICCKSVTKIIIKCLII